MAWTSSKWDGFWFSSSIWPWPQKNMGLLIKDFYTFGPILVILAWMSDEWWVTWTSLWLTHIPIQTDTNTRMPKLASGKKVSSVNFSPLLVYCCVYMQLKTALIYLVMHIHIIDSTRTTRTPVFWGYPLLPLDYLYNWFTLDSKSKQQKVKVTNLKTLLIL